MSAPTEPALQPTNVHQRVDRMTRALRVLGALLLLTSASSFLVHRWDGGHDLLRYGFLLCHSFVILGAALFCGGKLGESRSTRVFLWINLALIPAHFAVLGGLVYSQFPLDSAALTLPSYALWQAPNRLGVFVACAATLVTVLPTGLISARVLVPRRAKMLTAKFVGLCCLLLVPVRESDAAALFASMGALLALWVDRKVFAPDYRMRTAEGVMVRCLMAVPSALLLIRAAVFYSTTEVFTGVLILVASAVGFCLSREIRNNQASVDAGEWLSVLGAQVGMVFVLSGTLAFEALGPLALLANPALFLLASRLSSKSRSSFEVGAGVLALGICSAALLFEGAVAEGVTAVVMGAFVLAYSILLGRVFLGAFAGLTIFAGIGVTFGRAVGLEHLTNWGTLSALGILAVLGAALLERHREALIQALSVRCAPGNCKPQKASPAPPQANSTEALDVGRA